MVQCSNECAPFLGNERNLSLMSRETCRSCLALVDTTEKDDPDKGKKPCPCKQQLNAKNFPKEFTRQEFNKFKGCLNLNSEKCTHLIGAVQSAKAKPPPMIPHFGDIRQSKPSMKDLSWIGVL